MAIEESGAPEAEGADISADTGAVEEGAPAADAAPEAGAPAGEPSRVRASHWKALQKELGSVKETLTKSQQEWQAKLSQSERELSEMRGYLAAQRQQAEDRARTQEPSGPTASDLVKEAKKALDANDIDTYHEKMLAANEVRSRELVKSMLPKDQPQQRQQPQMDPVIQGMYSQYAQQVQDPQRLMRIAILEDQKLDAMGIPQGYDRYRSAFEAASSLLGGSKKETPKYSAGLAGTLSAPPSRPAAGNASQAGEERPLTAEERAAAEWMGGEKEYRKYVGR